MCGLIALGLGWLALGSRLGAAEIQPFDPVPWPEAITPRQQNEDIFGVKLRLIREMDGDKAATRFLLGELARNPRPYVKAYVAWYRIFGQGWGAPELTDPVKGRALAEEAAKEGSMVATELLGRALVYALGGERDLPRGLKLLRQAAEAGNTRAMAQLAILTAHGWGGLQNMKDADRFARRAGVLGTTMALVNIGELYEKGEYGYPRDMDKATAYYFAAASLWDDDAWVKLAALEQNGVKAAGMYIRIARLQNANDGASINGTSAIRKLATEMAAMAGDNPAALVELARAQIAGDYARRDYKQARERLEKAVAAGYRPARVFLAYMKLRGFGGPKEPAMLAELDALADQGEPYAANYLGWAYYWGASEVGVRKNEKVAFEFCRQAAERGSSQALINLGICYSSGIGTPKNYALAAKVYWQACTRGYSAARGDVRRLLAYVKL